MENNVIKFTENSVIKYTENSIQVPSDLLLNDLRTIFDKLAGQNWSIMTSDFDGVEITIKFKNV